MLLLTTQLLIQFIVNDDMYLFGFWLSKNSYITQVLSSCFLGLRHSKVTSFPVLPVHVFDFNHVHFHFSLLQP